jgi:hydroxymethylpyrimidine pyrophosphatase-like HAD family hydrolase
MRCCYLDLDGTLLGREGSLFHDAEGAVSFAGPRAIEALLRAGVEVMLVSGRRRVNVAENARLMGQRSFIYEAGAVLVLDGEEHWLTGDLRPRDGRTVYEQISATGAPELLLAHYGERLEHHAPWHQNREVSHLFRGLIDAGEADRLLAEHGHGSLRLVDNGASHVHSPAGLPQVRVYHLVPVGASKAAAVARHRRARGYERADTMMAGDSREDLACAQEVGAFWLVANALRKDPSLKEAIAGRGNVRVAEADNGAGVYEAVVSTLMGA